MLDTTLNARIQVFLDNFDAALAAGDIDAAVGMFAPECYWRDLVAFTWNITTMEGPDQVRDMLGSCLARVKPTQLENRRGGKRDRNRWRYRMLDSASRPARRAATGVMRLQDGRCRTLLTAMSRTKDHEEKAGPGAAARARHGAIPARKPGRKARARRRATSAPATQPYALVIGGGQGGIMLGARLQPARRAHHHHREERAPAIPGATAIASLVPARPGLVRPSALHSDFPKNWPVFIAQGQDRRLAGDVYARSWS